MCERLPADAVRPCHLHLVRAAPVRAGPVFDHLHRLTDERGLFEHAEYAQPRPEHGYCVDDVARALLVTCREPDPSDEVVALGRLYLRFTLSAVQEGGACHNRMDLDGCWTDRPGWGDWWGRALWGLGVAAVHAPTADLRGAALTGFRRAAKGRSTHPRALAFAALGAGELLLDRPGDSWAQKLLIDAVEAVGRLGGDPAWPWPWPRLTYASGAIVEALLLAGSGLPDPSAYDDGLNLLDFLLGAQTHAGHLSATPVSGRGPGEWLPAFDQQPIEVAALADACARAFSLTSNPRWLAGVRAAWAWFLGDNDRGLPMFNASTGGGYDGLTADGRNLNQGAESTLAMLSTAQHARRLGVWT